MMREIAAQVKHTPDGVLFLPHSIKDKEQAGEFVANSIVKLKVYGTKKARSLDQLALYWVCCRKVAANTADPDIDNIDKVDFRVKYMLKHFNHITVFDNKVVVEVGSISIKQLDHLEACRFFDRAFELMAKWLGITVDELLKEAE